MEPSKNKHEKGRIDSIHSLSHYGLKVATYEVRKWGEEYLLSVEMSKNYPQVSQDLQIGMTVNALIKRVGQPTAEKKNELEWILSSEQGEYAVMTVSLKKGKATKIVWLYFLD